ncbi:MAG: Rne/Rng family ribonuclease [Candidatus Marinimicrobia bacterium]|jgi:ribonuclease G|nr:Rne/Rng family ribonuclease [Candidatus Neomarinimicrobiota bacterium]|tara:strand:+ start:6678 stop:8180 length:1503 start_codon:yes stop_codon:yes gene_type:complete
MKKEIYISKGVGETRIAVTENGKLAELHVDKQSQERTVGNVYKGIVENVIPGMQAAFVNIGQGANAFLPFSEISDSELIAEKNEKTKHSKEIDVLLQPGQEIIVQVIKEPFDKKGARVTTELSIAGRFIVLIPKSKYIGVSKKMRDKFERRRLKKIALSIKKPGLGMILRTVAEGKTDAQIENDYKNLTGKYNDLLNKAEKNKAPALIHDDLKVTSNVLRDLISEKVEKIIVDSKDDYNKIYKMVKEDALDIGDALEHYRKREPLFKHSGIDNSMMKLLRKKAWLKSGAYLIIERTEAMVVVDVNSGKFVGKKGHEENSLKINLEAAKEVCAQLRLRHLSGLILIDFIDMVKPENRKKVFLEMKKELRKDRAKVAVSQISEFGVLEMTRERTGLSIVDSLTDCCEVCAGNGRILSKDTLLTRIDYWLRDYKKKHKDLRLKLFLHPRLADYLKKEKTRDYISLMWKNFVYLKVITDDSMNKNEFRFTKMSDSKDITNEIGT